MQGKTLTYEADPEPAILSAIFPEIDNKRISESLLWHLPVIVSRFDVGIFLLRPIL
jgi:hypothetical protein